MEGDYGMPACSSIGDFGIVRVAPFQDARDWSVSQDLFNGVGTGFPVEADVADGGNLMQAELGIFGLEIDDGLPDGRRQRAMVILLLFECRAEQAGHSCSIEGIRMPPERAFYSSRLFCPFGWCVAEQHNGAHKLVGTLLWSETLLADLAPIFSVHRSCACRHSTPTPHWAVLLGVVPL
jgi:hypothetical protein